MRMRRFTLVTMSITSKAMFSPSRSQSSHRHSASQFRASFWTCSSHHLPHSHKRHTCFISRFTYLWISAENRSTGSTALHFLHSSERLLSHRYASGKSSSIRCPASDVTTIQSLSLQTRQENSNTGLYLERPFLYGIIDVKRKDSGQVVLR